MMNRIFLVPITAAILLASCHSKDDMKQSTSDVVPIRLVGNTNLETLAWGDGTKGRAVTRATQDTELTASEKVYAWAKKNGESTWDYVKAWELEAQSTKTLDGVNNDLASVSTTSHYYYPSDRKTLDWRAVHGNFASAITEGTTTITSGSVMTHTIEADQNTGTNYVKSDLLYGTGTGAHNSDPSVIKFTHKLSKIEVNLSVGCGLDESDLANSEVKVELVKPTVTIDPTDGTLGAASGSTVNITCLSSNSGKLHECVLPPQDAAAIYITVKVPTINGATANLVRTIRNEVTTYASNTRYVYNVTVDYDYGIPLADVTSSNVGQIIAANGKVYLKVSDADYFSTAKAFIAYIGTAGTADASSSIYRGLACALEDADSYISLNQCAFCSKGNASCGLANKTSDAAARADMNGINATATLISGISGHVHQPVDAIVAFRSNIPAPTKYTSDWFLPSIGQWNIMIKSLVSKAGGSPANLATGGTGNNNMKTSVYETMLNNAGVTDVFGAWFYQSCTQYSNSNSYYVRLYHGNMGQMAKTSTKKVRAALAF